MDLSQQLSSSLIIIAPWSAAAALLVLATRAHRRSYGYAFLLTGIGGILGLFTVSGAIWLINSLAIGTYALPFKALALFASGIGLMVLVALFCHCIIRIKQPLEWCLLASIIGTLTVGFNHSILTPMSSWDTLEGEWRVPGYAAKALSLIGTNESEAFHGEIAEHRHPSTNVLLLSWSGWIAREHGNLGVGIPWFLLYLSCILIVAGCSFTLSGSTTASLLSAWLTTTLPLLENHALLAGYTEALVTAILLASCSLICVGIRRSKKNLIAMGLLIAVLLTQTRSTGSAYMAAVFFGYLTALGFSVQKKYLYGAICIALIYFFYLASQGFQVGLFGITVGWNPTTTTVDYAGRTQLIRELNLSQLAINQFYAMIANNSYSVAIIGLVSALIIQLSTKSRLSPDPSLVFILATFCFGVAFFSATQITEYGMLNALPGSDTLNSRSLMPLIPLSIIAIMHLNYFHHETAEIPARADTVNI